MRSLAYKVVVDGEAKKTGVANQNVTAILQIRDRKVVVNLSKEGKVTVSYYDGTAKPDYGFENNCLLREISIALDGTVKGA